MIRGVNEITQMKTISCLFVNYTQLNDKIHTQWSGFCDNTSQKAH